MVFKKRCDFFQYSGIIKFLIFKTNPYFFSSFLLGKQDEEGIENVLLAARNILIFKW